jgi:TPP-dependent 2-oxoacid decarboxylase
MKRINGADLLVSFLKDKGVKTIFSISGAGNLAILDAIVRDGMMQVIFSGIRKSLRTTRCSHRNNWWRCC